MPLSVPSPMRSLRDWARADTGISAAVADRVYLRIPETPPAYPIIRLYRTGGARQTGDTPIYDFDVAWDVWGGSDADYDGVESATAALIKALDYSGTVDMTSVRMLNADVRNVIFSPDPATGWPRQILDTLCTFVAL